MGRVWHRHRLVINLVKLIRDVAVLGGLAAFGAYLLNRNR